MNEVMIVIIGAVMFRGFKINEGVEFERAVKQVEPDLCDAYRGTSPRKLVQGTEVYSIIASYACYINGYNFLF